MNKNAKTMNKNAVISSPNKHKCTQ